MAKNHLGRALAIVCTVLGAAPGQAPLLHYQFDEGGAPVSTQNLGTFTPGSSALAGHTLNGVGPNGSGCLAGVLGSANEVTTPYAVALGTGSWTIGFCVNSAAGGSAIQYVMSDHNGASAWRVFLNGGAGAGNVRLTGSGLPSLDIAGGAGGSGWVHVAWVHDDAAGTILGYLNGANVSSVAAPTANVNSGLPLVLGRHALVSLGTGTLLDDFRLFDRALTAAGVSAWSASSLTPVAPDFRKVMISEVSWGDPDLLEITNFDTSPVSLTNWTVKWRDNFATHVSTPLNVVIAPGESIVVTESLPVIDAAPGAQVIDRFTTFISVTSGAILVTLLDPIGTPVDEVRITDTMLTSPVWTFGGRFRGIAVRGLISAVTGQVGVERIWGLDSDGGAEWTEQPNRSPGRENRSSGPPGYDPAPVPDVHISELARNPSYVELFNPGAAPIDLSGWHLLTSVLQGVAHGIHVIPAGTTIGAQGYAVLGASASAPSEKPASVPYVQTGAFSWSLSEFDCALYDNLGRVVDLVRVPDTFGPQVHNLPRAPSRWSDFVGATARNEWAGPGMGRGNAFGDNNTGADWVALLQRTMGSANSGGFGSNGGHSDSIDVRLDQGGLGGGLEALINAGATAAGLTWNLFLSATHSNGMGPFFGLGNDVLVYFPLFYNVPPWSGQLDSQGSGRIDLDAGSLPPGVNADFIFFLQTGSGVLTARTVILEFDT